MRWQYMDGHAKIHSEMNGGFPGMCGVASFVLLFFDLKLKFIFY